MPKQHPRLSVVIEPHQKARLEDLVRRVNYERRGRITVSHIVRDAIDAYLAREPSARLRRIADENPGYSVDEPPSAHTA